MKLKISTIPIDGLELDFSLDAQKLRQSFGSNDRLQQAMQTAIQVKLSVEKQREHVHLKGNFELALQPTCDRCLETFSYPLQQALSVTCMPRTMIDEEDDGLLAYHGDQIDLAEVVRDQLVLSLPMIFHCRQDCKGLCPNCGINLNMGQCSCEAAVQHA